MEAVPRLHMLWFAAKSSPEGTSFAALKSYIAEFYQEDPETYSKEVYALETLRNQAMHPAKDSCSVIKRYYCQLHSLLNRFPGIDERTLFSFSWKDLYQSHVHEITDLRYEMAAVLFNIAASHTQVGASVTRGDVDGMKVACTHFQCAAWAFGELRERFRNISGADFMTTGLLVFMQQVSFAQAQECILEKSLIDNRKPNIVAKVTAQIVSYYGAALAALLTGGEDGPVSQVIDSSVYKLWKKYVRFKMNYLSCILYLYQGQQAEEQQKMGERVTLYQAAWDKLEEARKESKGLPDQKEINESLTFTADVVEAKRKNAKNENEFIYHESVPELCNIAAVQGANLVHGISFNITDADVAGEDIFSRLVPMKAHEASSMYSEEKAKLLRKYGGLIEDKDAELASFMSSLTLDNLNINEEKANKIPQGIVDRCAALNANKLAIQELVSAMSQLAETCADVKTNLTEIANILSEEEQQEHAFQLTTGVKRTPNAHITELTREYQKYIEAHARAGESNDTLRKAMELHVNNLKILARPLVEIQQSVPKLSAELNTAEIFKDVKLIVNKVNEMKAQRSQFHAELRIAVNSDDITSKVIAHGSDEGLQHLFDRELSKHERITQLLDQNLLAQQNILQALTDAYAKAAPVLKTLADVKHKRDSFFSSLAASYDVYEDLLAKSAKGLEFYKKLSGNVQKLLARCKSARDVQSEERQQHLKNVNNQQQQQLINKAAAMSISASESVNSSAMPKLRDYLKAKKDSAAAGIAGNVLSDIKTSAAQYIPSIRPNPLGSENPSQTICSGNTIASTAPNEPPPPYSLQKTQYYDPNMTGYANPLYQQQQQHIAPPAYKLQASPNSQFPAATNAALSMQNCYNYMALQQQQQPQPQAQQQQAFAAACAYAQQPQQQQQQHSPYGYNLAAIDANIPTANMPRQLSSYNVATSTVAAAVNAYPVVPNQYGNAAASTASNANIPNPYNAVSIATTVAAATPDIATAVAANPYSSAVVNPYAANPYMPTAQQPQPQQAAHFAPTAQTMVQTAAAPAVSQTLPTAAAATQPLYVLTTQNEAVPPPTATLQSAYVLNALQQPAANNAGVLATVGTATAHAAASTAPATSAAASSSFGGTTKHPGYSYNSQTGAYEYGSGYHQAASVNTQFYGHYTSASAMQQMPTTDSENANKMNLATGFDSPIISHTKAAIASATTSNAAALTPQAQQQPKDDALHYYTPPYGYHLNMTTSDNATNGNCLQQQQTTLNNQQQQQQQLQQPQQQLQQQQLQLQQQQQQISQQSTTVNAAAGNQPFYTQQSIYMQSGSGTIANTQTTKSAAEYASSAQHTQPPPTSLNQTVAQAAAQSTQQQQPLKKVSNLDLLTDIDFNEAVLNVPAPMLPAPALQPNVLPNISTTEAAAAATEAETTAKAGLTMAGATPIAATIAQPTAIDDSSNASILQPNTKQATGNRQASFDNLSICSDLSSLDNNFDWDALSNFGAANSVNNDKHANSSNATFLLKPFDAFVDDKTLKYFYKEVERYEKTIESLNVRMLNGHTQLSAKWKELQDILTKDALNMPRLTTVAKLFPEKNRSFDCLPYDHARVKLDSITDDYINAAFVHNLGSGCPNFIFSQTPQSNTVKDFWSMVWSQKSRTVLSLHTTNEMLDPFWPQQLHAEMPFDDYTVRCVQINTLSHCIEYYLKLSMHGADAILDLSLLQIKAWSKDSAAQLLNIARNGLQAHQQRCLEFNQASSPLILNCLTGTERSGLIAVGICSILATQTKRPILINVIDVWARICAQRQNALRDMSVLEQSMQIVLNHAHDVLNKRGILTSYQMKIAPQVASKEKEEIKDPLSELDPLWKLK